MYSASTIDLSHTKKLGLELRRAGDLKTKRKKRKKGLELRRAEDLEEKIKK